MYVVIVSLDTNFENLIIFLKSYFPVDIISLSETRVNDRNLDITGYTLYHCNSETKAGGSAIFVSDSLKNVKKCCKLKSNPKAAKISE